MASRRPHSPRLRAEYPEVKQGIRQMPFGDGRGHFGMLAQIRLLVEFVLEGVLDGYGGAVRLGFRLSQALSARLPLLRGLACRCDFFAHRFVPVGRNEMLNPRRVRARPRFSPWDRRVPVLSPR